jgi:hypothetical protein
MTLIFAHLVIDWPVWYWTCVFILAACAVHSLRNIPRNP